MTLNAIRSAFVQLCPPVILPIARRLIAPKGGGNLLQGQFSTWNEAVNEGSGYDDAEILRRVEEAALKVMRGDAAFERDAVAFEETDWPYPLLATFLRLALERQGSLCVLDFGGSLGSTYHQCRAFMNGVRSLRWKVVEQSHYVQRGRQVFENQELQFFESVEEAVRTEQPDVALFSGVLQYLENPYEVLRTAAQATREAVIIDRTPWSKLDEDVITLQVIPPQFYRARVPFRVFAEGNLERAINSEYKQIDSLKALDPDLYLGKNQVHFGCWFFERRDTPKTNLT